MHLNITLHFEIRYCEKQCKECIFYVLQDLYYQYLMKMFVFATKSVIINNRYIENPKHNQFETFCRCYKHTCMYIADVEIPSYRAKIIMIKIPHMADTKCKSSRSV